MNRSIQSLIVQSWDNLSRAPRDKNHPYRLAVLSGLDAFGRPRGRTVVLRQAERATAELYLFSDARTNKVVGLRQQNWLSWTFWHPRQSLQTIAGGPSSLLSESERRPFFEQLSAYNWADYSSLLAPGETLEEEAKINRKATTTDQERAWRNFCVIRTQVQEMDILHLQRSGHQRVLAQRDGSEWKLQIVQS
ncbi:MAG: hypothetical protein AAF433_09925 [Bacteroidota bacterium]